MPRKPGMALGPGAAAGGGLGKKPQPPKTAMAGKPMMGAPAGMPPPMPGNRPPGAGGGGMGGAPGFKKGGKVEKEGSKAEEARDRREDKW